VKIEFSYLRARTLRAIIFEQNGNQAVLTWAVSLVPCRRLSCRVPVCVCVRIRARVCECERRDQKTANMHRCERVSQVHIDSADLVKGVERDAVCHCEEGVADTYRATHPARTSRMVFVCRPAVALVIVENVSDFFDGLFLLFRVGKAAFTRQDAGT